jgi:hypothetical protein
MPEAKLELDPATSCRRRSAGGTFPERLYTVQVWTSLASMTHSANRCRYELSETRGRSHTTQIAIQRPDVFVSQFQRLTLRFVGCAQWNAFPFSDDLPVFDVIYSDDNRPPSSVPLWCRALIPPPGYHFVIGSSHAAKCSSPRRVCHLRHGVIGRDVLEGGGNSGARGKWQMIGYAARLIRNPRIRNMRTS